MLYTVHLYNETEDVKKGYGDIVTFNDLTVNGAFDIVMGKVGRRAVYGQCR